MPRRKMTEEEKKARRDKKAREQKEENLRHSLERLKESRARRVPFGEPIHTFVVGDRVEYGSHDNAEVLEVEDNWFYKIKVWGLRNNYGKMVPYTEVTWIEWYGIGPARSEEEIAATPIHSYRDDVRLDYSTTGVTSLVHTYHSQGVGMTPEYQRDHVWTNELRMDLIESIFNNIDIGKFVFRDLGYRESGPMYEIIDGKQRLTTLILFAEGRLTWRGKTFFELNPRDQGHFENFLVQSAKISERVTEAQVLKLFLKLNTGGVAQDPEHLANVQKRLDELDTYEQKCCIVSKS